METRKIKLKLSPSMSEDLEKYQVDETRVDRIVGVTYIALFIIAGLFILASCFKAVFCLFALVAFAFLFFYIIADYTGNEKFPLTTENLWRKRTKTDCFAKDFLYSLSCASFEEDEFILVSKYSEICWCEPDGRPNLLYPFLELYDDQEKVFADNPGCSTFVLDWAPDGKNEGNYIFLPAEENVG